VGNQGLQSLKNDQEARGNKVSAEMRERLETGPDMLFRVE
jgi:hypothetical protein